MYWNLTLLYWQVRHIKFTNRRVSSEALDFPVVTACPLYCYELGTCNTSVGVASLDEQFAGLSIPDEYGNTCVYNILQSSALFLFLSCVLTQHTIFSILYLP